MDIPESADALARAIALSHEGLHAGAGGPFGAVVTRDGKIVGTGYNRVLSENDPTAHAEMLAIRSACAAIGSYSLADCVLYASCEPCPMCLAAALWARIPLCRYANTKEDATRIGFDDAAFYEQFSLRRDAERIRVARTSDQSLLQAAEAVFDEALRMPTFRRY